MLGMALFASACAGQGVTVIAVFDTGRPRQRRGDQVRGSYKIVKMFSG